MTLRILKSVFYIFYTLTVLCTLQSSQTAKNNFVKNNFEYNVFLFNKNLGISSEFFGDMRIIDSTLVKEKNVKKLLKGVKVLKNKKIIAYFKTIAEPDYETILFLMKLKE